MVNTHNLTINFGKHKGELWTRVPISYLKWIINTQGEASPIAQAELDRRGTTLERTVEVSAHAIDRASTRLLKQWRHTRLHKHEGLHSWLHRLATEALAHGVKEDAWSYAYVGIRFKYDFGEVYPTLTTVMEAKTS